MTGECVDACLGNHYESNFFPISSASCDMVTVKWGLIRLKTEFQTFYRFNVFFCCKTFKMMQRHRVQGSGNIFVFVLKNQTSRVPVVQFESINQSPIYFC